MGSFWVWWVSWFFSDSGEAVGSSLLTPLHYNFSIGVILLFAIEYKYKT